MNFIAAIQILSAAVKGDTETTPCIPEYTSVLTCMRDRGNDVCFSCILDSVSKTKGNITFTALVESNLCDDLTACAVEKCDPGCSLEWNTLYTCAEGWAKHHAEDADICKGLSELALDPKDAPILIQDFILPQNYTRFGLEMSSC